MDIKQADTFNPAMFISGCHNQKIEFPQPYWRHNRKLFQAAKLQISLSNELDLEGMWIYPIILQASNKNLVHTHVKPSHLVAS